MISLICGIQKTATHRKRDQICGHQGWGVADGELAEAGQKVSVSSYISTGDITYNMMTIFNTAAWYV